MIKQLLSIISVFAVVSCNNDKYLAKTSMIDAFPIERELVLNSLGVTDQLGYPTRIFCFDEVLAMKDNLSNEGQITLVSLGDSIKVKNILKQGRGPNELLNVWYLTAEDTQGNFWALDIVASDVIRINLYDALNSNFYSRNKLALKNEAKRTISIDLLNDSLFIAAGRFDGFRVATIDGSGNIIEKAGLSPNITKKNKFDPFLNEAYQGVIKRRPDMKKYLIACKYSDQIEIFDSQKSEQEIFIKGPLFSEPTYNIVSAGLTGAMALDRDACIEGYCDVAVTDDYIIGLFSGRQLSKPNSVYANTIHMFDWEGNPVAKFTVDQECLSLDIDASGERLYLLSTLPTPEIHYFDLTL